MNLPILFPISILIIFNLIAIAISLKKDRAEQSSPRNMESSVKTDFVNVIVHELRAPVTAIKDAVGVLLSGKSSLSKHEEKQFLKIIHKQSELLLDQIGIIMDAAKLEAGKLSITKLPGDITGFISQQTKMFLLQAKKKNIDLAVKSSHTPTIAFDPIRIGQVLNNLLSNSLKFTKEGGKISVEVKRSNSDENYVVVSVKDTGIGISKEFQKNLFSKYSQSLLIPKEIAKQGTGLGLYVAKGIIDAHSGTISVESESGKGTTISFTLPIANQLI